MPKGVFKRSPEHIANIKKALTGLKRTPETCQRISEAKTGVRPNIPPEVQERLSKFRSERFKGEGSHFFGKSPSARACEQSSLANKNMSFKLCRKIGITPDEYRAHRAAGRHWCRVCRQFLPEPQFSKGKRKNQCDACHPMAERAASLRKNFGPDAAEYYQRKLIEQGSKCGICRSTEKKSRHGFFAIDHDHKTGELRGLLCTHCNTVTGIVESPIYDSILAYLARYAQLRVFSSRVISMPTVGVERLASDAELREAAGFMESKLAGSVV